MAWLDGLVLHDAASTGDYDTLAELIKRGEFDINLADEDFSNKTPLHWACEKGFVECARLLIENGAKTNPRTITGWTPAHFAAEAGKIAVLRALHAARVSMDKKDKYGATPRRMAEIYGHPECEMFLQQAELELAERRKELGMPESDEDETVSIPNCDCSHEIFDIEKNENMKQRKNFKKKSYKKK